MGALGMQAHAHQTQKLSQRMMTSPQMQKNLALLMSSIQELQHDISVELESNPALEILEESTESIEKIEFDTHRGNEIREKKEFLESLLTLPETLADHLLWQLRMLDIPEHWYEIGEVIIENLDENGFFKEDPREICAHLLNSNAQDVEKLIEIIQEIDPVGCATTNALESLHIQLSMMEIDLKHRTQLDNFIEEIEQLLLDDKFTKKSLHVEKKIDEIMQKYKTDEVFCEYFNKLVPYPGRAYAHNREDREVYVIPDAIIDRDTEGLLIRIYNDIIPVLTINKSIEKALHASDPDAKKLASEWISNARSFIEGIHMRAFTLEKIVSYIANYQQEFFLGQSDFLKPLTGKQIAEELNLNESTISRAISNKYIQCGKGLFEIKYFFSQRSGSQEISGQQIKTEIEQVIQELKSTKSKVSDRIIAEMLVEKGINIARRTVSKYRRSLES